MRKLILTLLYSLALLFFSAKLFATDWYVDKNATGNNSGTSWANACSTFASIPWGSMSNGDDVYISGGTDSTIYYETLAPELRGVNSSNWSIITTGAYSSSPSGHDGKVIIDGSSQIREGILLLNGGSGKPSYLKIKGLTIQNVTYGSYANFDEAHDCISFDSLTILNHGERALEMVTLLAYNVDSIFVENCRFVSDTYYDGESDGIYFSGTHHNFVNNNYIRVPNQQPTAHVDVLQGYLTDGWVITNNVFINDSVNSVEGGGIPIILGAEGSLPVIIYNNFIYMGGVWFDGGAWAGTLMTRWYDTPPMPPTWIIHNTVVSNGPRVRGVWLEFATATNTTLINNIIAQFSTDGVGDELSTFDNSTGSNLRVDSIRNNLYYQDWDGGASWAGNLVGSGGSPTGTPSSWTDFVTNYGGTGVNDNPDFTTNFGYEPNQGLLDGELQATSPAINAGENAEWYISYLNSTYGLNGRLTWTDINGNSRDATPDLGAWNYGVAATDTVPNSFTVTDVSNAELTTEYISSQVTPTGYDECYLRASGYDFRVNGGSWVTGWTQITDGDYFEVRRTSSGSYSTAVNTPVTAGGVNDTWTITTKDEPVSGVTSWTPGH